MNDELKPIIVDNYIIKVRDYYYRTQVVIEAVAKIYKNIPDIFSQTMYIVKPRIRFAKKYDKINRTYIPDFYVAYTNLKDKNGNLGFGKYIGFREIYGDKFVNNLMSDIVKRAREEFPSERSGIALKYIEKHKDILFKDNDFIDNATLAISEYGTLIYLKPEIIKKMKIGEYEFRPFKLKELKLYMSEDEILGNIFGVLDKEDRNHYWFSGDSLVKVERAFTDNGSALKLVNISLKTIMCDVFCEDENLRPRFKNDRFPVHHKDSDALNIKKDNIIFGEYKICRNNSLEKDLVKHSSVLADISAKKTGNWCRAYDHAYDTKYLAFSISDMCAALGIPSLDFSVTNEIYYNGYDISVNLTEFENSILLKEYKNFTKKS